MTREEAAEEILRGEFTVPCPNCCGKGGTHIHDEISYCSGCAGFGKLVRAEYLTACRLLGRELPMMPKSEFQEGEEAAWQLKKFAEMRKRELGGKSVEETILQSWGRRK